MNLSVSNVEVLSALKYQQKQCSSMYLVATSWSDAEGLGIDPLAVTDFGIGGE